MIAAHRDARRMLRRGRATPVPRRRLLVWLISATDGRDHAITLEEMEAVATGQGPYHAVCGHLVLVCAMTTPPGPRCSSCDELLRTPPPKQRGWTAALRSVLGRHPEPAVAKHRRRKGHL
ncbi:MAG: hypothetical protein ACRDRH_29310 [Pseudonocardia sp.]